MKQDFETFSVGWLVGCFIVTVFFTYIEINSFINFSNHLEDVLDVLIDV